MGRVFGWFVVRPLGLAHGIWGDRVWPPLERVAGLLGWVGGRAARPLLASGRGEDHPLRALLRFTDVVEGSLGIVGTNDLGADGTASRRVTHCPFASSLADATGFCTRLGHVAGRAAFGELVPGSDFDVVRTLSQGHDCCEYRYYRR